MNNNFWEKIGVTSGPWADVGGVIFGDANNSELDGDHPLVTHMPIYRDRVKKETGKVYPIEDAHIIANSLEAYEALIDAVYWQGKIGYTEEQVRDICGPMVTVLEKALDRQWAEIKTAWEETV